MTSFTFSFDELKSAPAEVRHWLMARVQKELLAAAGAAPAPNTHDADLAACSLDEATRLLDLIRNDFAAVQVFFELARETSYDSPERRFHALSIAEMMRHTRLSDGRLAACLRTINLGFQRVRNDDEARLFGFDQANHVYISEATHRSIRAIWAGLVGMTAPAASTPIETDAPPESGFLPPRLGPSEDIATHHHG